LTEECLIDQLEGKVVHSSKLWGIFQSHSFCTSPAVKIAAALLLAIAQTLKSRKAWKCPCQIAKPHHSCHPFAGQYISSMNQSIKHLCCRFNQFILFLCEHITYPSESIARNNQVIETTRSPFIYQYLIVRL
jgi:hypothetical protein